LTRDIQDIYDRCRRLGESDHRVTSQPTDKYNCVGWIDRELDRWWEPGVIWPRGVPEPDDADDNDLPAYVAFFEHRGFRRCDDSTLEDGFLKIALYVRDNTFAHVAKQLPSGGWSSKIGDGHDVRHEQLDALHDAVFYEGAMASVFMKRAYDGVYRYENEERGYFLPDGVE
jgi:hypothetical protein